MKYALLENNSFGKTGEIKTYFDNKEELIKKLVKDYNLSHANYDEMKEKYKEYKEEVGETEGIITFKDFLEDSFNMYLEDEEVERFINKETRILYSFDEKTGENLGTIIENNKENIYDINYCLNVFGDETTPYGVRNTYEIKEVPEYKNIVIDTTKKDILEIGFIPEEGTFDKIDVKISLDELKDYLGSKDELESFIVDEIKDTITLKGYNLEDEELVDHSINSSLETHLDNIIDNIKEGYDLKFEDEEEEDEEI